MYRRSYFDTTLTNSLSFRSNLDALNAGLGVCVILADVAPRHMPRALVIRT